MYHRYSPLAKALHVASQHIKKPQPTTEAGGLVLTTLVLSTQQTPKPGTHILIKRLPRDSFTILSIHVRSLFIWKMTEHVNKTQCCSAISYYYYPTTPVVQLSMLADQQSMATDQQSMATDQQSMATDQQSMATDQQSMLTSCCRMVQGMRSGFVMYSSCSMLPCNEIRHNVMLNQN